VEGTFFLQGANDLRIVLRAACCVLRTRSGLRAQIAHL
jgi:hypothetical protein